MRLLALFAVLCLSANAGDAESTVHDHSQSVLPNGPEKALVLQYCVGCHELKRIEHAGGTTEGWSDRVRRMIRWGAKIPTDQVYAVAVYLAKALPPRLRQLSESSAPLNTTVSDTSMHDIQTTVRMAGVMDRSGKTLTASANVADAPLIRAGQRVRAFALRSRSSMYQGKIVRVATQGGEVFIEALLSARPNDPTSNYVVEVVVERGRFLSIPSEAIIEENGGQLVYVQRRAGEYEPRQIRTGVQGDLYTQVVAGLTAGEGVVTLGSFFIDSEYKMKMAGP